MSPAGFEPPTFCPVRLRTNDLDNSATGTEMFIYAWKINVRFSIIFFHLIRIFLTECYAVFVPFSYSILEANPSKYHSYKHNSVTFSVCLFSLLSMPLFLASIFNLLQYIVRLRMIDEGSIRKTSVWSVLLIRFDVQILYPYIQVCLFCIVFNLELF